MQFYQSVTLTLILAVIRSTVIPNDLTQHKIFHSDYIGYTVKSTTKIATTQSYYSSCNAKQRVQSVNSGDTAVLMLTHSNQNKSSWRCSIYRVSVSRPREKWPLFGRIFLSLLLRKLIRGRSRKLVELLHGNLQGIVFLFKLLFICFGNNSST